MRTAIITAGIGIIGGAREGRDARRGFDAGGHKARPYVGGLLWRARYCQPHSFLPIFVPSGLCGEKLFVPLVSWCLGGKESSRLSLAVAGNSIR
ncbi:hypothetical protein F8S13_21500 [Chloroflexia bacterium SDU3-3]|nr:hypothetical protein F8S13_21500 [Chloroflexia bacterium SDU3-3]